MQELSRRSGGGKSANIRIAASIASAVILAYFAVQISGEHNTTLPYKIGIDVVIAVIGIAGIHALLTPEADEEQPGERLYTSDEVAALVAAVQSGRLVPADAQTCKFCKGAQPEVTGLDGSRYHRSCFQAAYTKGKT